MGPLYQRDGQQPNLSLSQVLSTSRIREGGSRSSKAQQKAPIDTTVYLSVYKSKEDMEPIMQHSIASITDVQIQNIAHRKQGHVIPTLTIQIAPDPATDKLRKRRSSRTTGLISSKESGPTTLYFVPPEDARWDLGAWHSELSSPASTLEERPEQFIEGWTTAQGRSSALSSPIRGRGSISSSIDPKQPSLGSSPPMVPRETILDRAFQMRYIPGSEREIAGEEKLTSLARFEALMCEAENRQRNTGGRAVAQEPLKSTWEHDESDEDDFGRAEDDGEDDDSDNYAFEQNVDHDEMDASTFKALRFIANRHNSTYAEPTARNTPPSVSRPQTAHSRSRPTAQRMSSQPYISPPPVHVPSARYPEGVAMRRSHEKRHSTSDVKNFNNFNDFTKRLSGTSSLLLVQSNASVGSNRGSGDYDAQHTPRGSISTRGTAQTSDERCRWRGSIGVFGNEGGFL
ncbi:hypothetical protein ONZ43_g1329 [Nemania bipapillata]|uniref:Uncharacterized protein n=1 Tax=Nemania bipapillata TaxID=110536 RepID=A0ACC2J4X5_9PEZI|nr:hypothetical protein ONZ43_g1329 [Nemania bipapillata]